MSPLSLRRYRADRLLRGEFERLRANVLGAVAARLRAVGVRLDASDLDACYAQAWQGLYASVLDGGEIESPDAWLVRVTYRRAIDEHRARGRVKRTAPPGAAHRGGHGADGSHAALAGYAPAEQRDLAERLDDRVRLRHVFEAMRARLSVRERQAATLCYLQGLSRAEAAARMGVSEQRMHKLMDGRGDGAPGVAQKVGALVETIDAGRWCEEQGSLMRGFAYGILDPAGERYRLADAHRSECPACRAYVLSLRGLAAVLPPVPSLLHLLLGSGALAGGGATAAGSGGASGSGLATGAQVGNAGAGGAGGAAQAGAGAGALSASGAAGAAGGGWWLAGGSLGAKLAAGCVLALGVGAGCVALGGGAEHAPARLHRAHAASAARRSRDVVPTGAQTLAAAAGAASVATTTSAPPTARGSAAAPSRQAVREFGPEQPASSASAPVQASALSSPTAHAASAAESRAGASNSTASASSSGVAGAGVPAAQREFAPG